MKPIDKEIMLGMISILNQASQAYYSGSPIMSDAQFDARLEDLKQLEEETGIVFANSPSINVGAKILSDLPETTHNHPMLSLDKCHTVQEVIKFSNDKELIASIKCDGMTVSLLYEDGIFVKGESRGNGYIGNDITEHVKQFLNVPLKIGKQGKYIVDGEAIIMDEDFAEINKNNEFKNSRNTVAGTLSSLDTSVVSQRKVKFICWDVIEGGCNSLKDNLNEAKEIGFDVVPYWFVPNSSNGLNPKNLQSNIDYVFDYAEDNGYPNDGIVFKFDDIEYGKSLGKTEHHFKNGIAYKRKDNVYETKLIDIEFTMGKTGVLTPTAIFKTVDINGSSVSRASVHNISILKDLDLHVGDTIEVFKANSIIPQVKRNVSADERLALGKENDYIFIPSMCPVCGGNTELVTENNSTVLVCVNDNCKGKLLGKLTHFVSKNAMNIDGLSEASLEKFIELGWLSSFEDIYNLKEHYSDMVKLDGFGEKSVIKLIDAIENSKNTTLDRFIYSLSIPLIGRSASKTIAKYFKGDFDRFCKQCCLNRFDFTVLDDFGDAMNDFINNYIKNNVVMIDNLAKEMYFEKPNVNSGSNNYNCDLTNKNIVITGSLSYFKNRNELQEIIENLGGKVLSSINGKTYLLINNDINSNSSKNKIAKELNINIVTEEEFLRLINYGKI